MNPVQATGARQAVASSGGLTEEELTDARSGFERYLRGKGFSRAFIAEHAEDLMGKASMELAKKLDQGEEVRNAPGLLITIAYRRTQNLLESKERSPDLVGLESVGELADDGDDAPEATALDRDRVGKVRAAVSRLTVEERKIVALEFFEDMNLSQAARSLGWDESKARRRHKAAMAHLKDLLGVDSSDQVVFDIAFLCWLAVAFGDRLDFSVGRMTEAAWNRIEDLGISMFDRVQAVGHRGHARLASDPVAASAAGSAGRAAKVCGAALICAVGAGASVVVVNDEHGADSTPKAVKAAHHNPKPAAVSVEAPARQKRVVRSAKVDTRPAESGSGGHRAQKKAHRSGGVSEQRQVVNEEAPPAVTESAPAHASQPPPSEVLSTLEETNRPTSGQVEAHPSSGAGGSEVGEVEKASGKTEAIESLEAGRP